MHERTASLAVPLLFGAFFGAALLAAPPSASALPASPVPASLARAQEEVASDVLTPHLVARLKNVSSAAMSPDGRHVAFTVSVPREAGVDDDGGSWSELHIHDVESGESRPYVTGEQNVGSVSWTPDGSGIAFLAKREGDEDRSLYVLPLGGGEARRVATIAGGIGGYDLAPDGEHVAVVATAKLPEAREKERKKGFTRKVYEEELRRAGVHVLRLDDEDAEPRAIELDVHVYDVIWSPDGERLAVKAAPTPLVDDQYTSTRWHVVDAAEGSVLATLETPGKIGGAAWSPDGERLALIAAADQHDPSAGRLCVADPASGAYRDVLPGFDGQVERIAWQSPSELLYLASVGVWTKLGVVQLGDDGEVVADHELVSGGPILSSLSLSDDGHHGAFVGDSPQHPSELFVATPEREAIYRATTTNEWLADIRLAPQEPVTYTARDGVEIEGILIRPLDEEPGVRYPLVMVVHGGPEAHESNGWRTSYSRPGQVAAARGMAVFMPNYRGSTGRGVEFSKLSQGEPGGAEFDDLVDGIRHLADTGLVDPDKVGVTGGSYGGYATAWCSTKLTEHFAAGVMFVGISNNLSKFGTTDIPDEMYLVHSRKRVWEDWQFFLERSPIFWAEQARTPLLILHGEDDPRVNVGQSMELYRHYKLHGKTPVRLVLYPGEGHGNRKAAARLDYALRSLRWMEHYLKGPGGDAPPPEVDYADPDAPADEEEATADAAADGQARGL